MVGAHCTTFSFFTPAPTAVGAATATVQRKPIFLCSISNYFLLKRTKRKNYLRPKLLETLQKPCLTTPLLPRESSVPIEYHEIPHRNSSEPTSGESCSTVGGEDDKIEHQNEIESREFQLSPTSGTGGVDNGDVGKFSMGSFLKLGLCLVGIFVFQTICAVWVLGSANSDRESEISDSERKGSELGVNGRNKGNFLLNGDGKIFAENFGYKSSNVVSVDESVLEEKIEEIRAMAREARESEAKKLKNLDEVGGGVVNENAISSVRNGIQEEVESRLINLQKRLNAKREKSPVSSVSHLNKSDKVKDRVNGDNSDVTELNGRLMFKKKMKFRSALAKPRNDPKGFQHLEEVSGSVPATKESNLLQNHGKVLEEGREGRKTGGIVDAESRKGKREPSEEETKNSQSFTKENQKSVTNPDAMLRRNGSSNSRKVGTKPAAKGFRDKSSDIKADLWWLRLPYVIAVLMRRGSNHEGPGGLYTLKTNTRVSDPIDSSYTVAFEDRVDATNFCYLLESFFEDLGDFSADIVPLSIKELHKAVKSDGMKVIVVKKGQLQLYAGQPLTDVEMTLRALVNEIQMPQHQE